MLLLITICLLFFFFVFALLFSYLCYSGIFHRVEIRTGAPSCFNDIYLGYKFYVGSYHEVGKSFKLIGQLTSTKTHKLIGIYYDDPEKVVARTSKLTYSNQ